MSAERIVGIYRRVLNTAEVDEHSDFFELGGDSLLATRVLSAIARDFDIELTYDDIVDHPTPLGLFDLTAAVTS
ncbi:acyl carrier protein [Mycobacterium sp. NAZ190054]|uniref:acyl carrier protein n=1 Tax=Mycobacterium sp. NAZ190054 TaxID=1747766 RepID=UPI000792BB3F|nr:acyl carrier protein [Mycobacterium sp. NAZ190054]KWX66499.1 phosphopantetheine-containing protein [Mycobacterium sp. NAZ190054]